MFARPTRRVSTDDQATAVQLEALRTADCGRVFEERASGGRWDRPELHRMLDQLRNGDVVIVWKLDRLFTSWRAIFLVLLRSRPQPAQEANPG
ncbi:recombinase family protein [Yoonia maritima]|uniref:recombinase family protein n=1 Tax=Yoonia maritima TaxID=1435347 RepID=UPI001FAE77BE|nr:recombinase family protein [Yoonia maritima]